MKWPILRQGVQVNKEQMFNSSAIHKTGRTAYSLGPWPGGIWVSKGESIWCSVDMYDFDWWWFRQLSLALHRSYAGSVVVVWDLLSAKFSTIKDTSPVANPSSIWSSEFGRMFIWTRSRKARAASNTKELRSRRDVESRNRLRGILTSPQNHLRLFRWWVIGA